MTLQAAAPVFCPIERAVDVVGGRWKTMIVYHLLEGSLPYAHLRRRLVGCSERVFVRQVRELERDGIVERVALGGNPPRVDYRVTPLGRELQAMFDAMARWGTLHGVRVTADTARADPASACPPPPGGRGSPR